MWRDHAQRTRIEERRFGPLGKPDGRTIHHAGHRGQRLSKAGRCCWPWRWSSRCPALARAGIKVESGVQGELRANVVTFLSVERNRDLKDIDQETMTRLFNRIDGEVRGALRPFGYYEPR